MMLRSMFSKIAMDMNIVQIETITILTMMGWRVVKMMDLSLFAEVVHFIVHLCPHKLAARSMQNTWKAHLQGLHHPDPMVMMPLKTQTTRRRGKYQRPET